MVNLVKWLIVLLFLMLLCNRQEAFETKPNAKKVEEYTQTVKTNRVLFRKPYLRAKSKLPWLDPVLYYDLSKLDKLDKMTDDNIRKVLSK